MKRIKKLVAVTGEYEKDGQTKKQYANIGSLFQREDGSMAIKIDTIPVNFNGWASAYDLDEQRQQTHDQGMGQAREAVQPAPQAEAASFEDDVPF